MTPIPQPKFTKRYYCSNITNTITDRCPTNQAVVRRLNEAMDKTLLMLNCALHPLDGLCNNVRKELKRLDKGMKGSSKGTDCLVGNLLMALSKLMNSGKGDPGGFRQVIREKTNLTTDGSKAPEDTISGLFMRYVGNRLHVFFHLAGALYAFRDELVSWMKYSTVAESLVMGPLEDLSNPYIVEQLRVVGMLGKFVTSPWMRYIYANEGKLSHLELTNSFFPVCFQNLEQAKEDPQTIVQGETDVFGKPYRDHSIDEILGRLREGREFTEGELSTAKVLILGFVDVLKRQMAEYYPGGTLADPSKDLMEQTKSAPGDNIFAERVLGTADNIARRAPNATVQYVDSYVRITHNKTLNWLESRESSEFTDIISFARKQLKSVETSNKRINESLNKELMQQMLQRRIQKDKKSLMEQDKKIQVLVSDCRTEAFLTDSMSSEIKKQLYNLNLHDLYSEDFE